MKKLLFVFILLIMTGCLFAGEYLISDFGDTDISLWTKAGHSEFLNQYYLNIANDESYCLELIKDTTAGWFGVNLPNVNNYPISNIKGFSFDLRNALDCPEVSFTVFLKDKSRWNCVVPMNGDSWTHAELVAESFFPEENPEGLSKIDFSIIDWIWISMRPKENSQRAIVHLDNIKINCDIEESNMGEEITVNKLANLKGVKVTLVDTSILPMFGQSENAIDIIQKALKKAGAIVTVVNDITKLNPKNSVIVYESPVIGEGDFEYINKALQKGNSLLWLGVDKPFSRIVKGNEMHPDEDTLKSNSYRLTQGTFQAFDAIQNKNKFKLTEDGEKVFGDLPFEFSGVNANFLTVNDSIWLNQQYPWVDFKPLLTVDYHATNWVFLDRPFTGSVVSEFVHHAGRYAGSRMIFVSMSTAGNSIINPQSGAYNYVLTSLVKEASQKVNIQKGVDEIPPAPFKVTRENFFHNDFKIMGGLNFNGCDMSDEDNIYALKRMGNNCILIGIPWTTEKTEDGYYIDFKQCDKWIKDAEKIDIGIIFDPYPFGWERFPWANIHNGKSAKMHVYNKTFRDEFANQMKALCERYKDSPALLAVYGTPDTSTMGFAYPDDSDTTREAWEEYAKAHGLNPALPTKADKERTYKITLENEAYVEFWYENLNDFMTKSVETIRSVIPDLPILLRGSYIDVAQSFRFAQNYKDMGPYCECMETSNDVETYFRGYSINYDTTIGGENGWPKERGPALRHAMADILLGGYKYFLFSFASIPYACPGTYEFDKINRVWGNIINADRVSGNTGFLVSDSTIWTSYTGSFFEIESVPNSGFLIERMGIPYGAVSAQWLDNLDRYKVLVDNGDNFVLNKKSREKLAEWIKGGGSLICYEKTGSLDMGGREESLEKTLGISFVPGEYSVGQGKVFVLDRVMKDDSDFADYMEVFEKAGSKRVIKCDKPISSTAYEKDGKIYYVFYNKSREQIGSYFSEHTQEAVQNMLTDTDIVFEAPVGMTKAVEICSEKTLPIKDGKVALRVPKSDYSLVMFE